MNLLDTNTTKAFRDERGGSAAEDDVLEYLSEIFNATKRLVRVEEKDDEDVEMAGENSESPNSPDEFVSEIANNLVEACDPVAFACGTSNLPTINTFKFDENFEIDNNIVKDSDFVYQHRRSDYLRRLLRVLAPISMEVTAKICSKAISSQRRGLSSSEREHQPQQLALVILFSQWLPVAPHLTPMVTEMFKSMDNPFRGLSSENVELDVKSKEQMFLVVEALYRTCHFFAGRGEISILRGFGWEWTFVFALLHDTGDAIMHDTVSEEKLCGSDMLSMVPIALKWFSVRILSSFMGWNSSVTIAVLEAQNVDDDRVPWQMHPWELDQEEVEIEQAYFQRKVFLWNESIALKLPSSEEIQAVLQPSPYLAIVGPGIAMYRQGSFSNGSDIFRGEFNSGGDGVDQSGSSGRLIPTNTTNRNLALLGAAMCHDPHPQPILVCGPQGSGKSSLIRELLRLCRPKESLIEFHIDEETDSKTLIGSYTTTDIPGEFAWRAGALTNASREGRWVLIEDLDRVPVEIQAALVKLFEDRMIPLGNGKYERSHPSFRIFATCTTNAFSSSAQGQERHSLRIGNHRGGGKQILNPSYWRNVHVKPMPYSELKEVAITLYTDVPVSVVDSAMTLLQALDRSGREPLSDRIEEDEKDEMEEIIDRMRNLWAGVRIPSVRDFFKLLSRICNGICFEKEALYTTEAQRTLCMAESVDIFMGSCPDQEIKDEFIAGLAAPVWRITKSLALNYMRARKPSVLVTADYFEIGRAKFHTTKSIGFAQKSSPTFAETSHALRLMESIAVCVRENEPILLVGETGCGKTTNIQQLASRCERTLIVQNLSLQTDSTDLLGGYRPLEIQNVARNVYKDFVDAFVSSFSRKQNLKFLQYASSMLEKSNWKKLSQCFKRAAQLGLKKMKERQDNQETSNSDSLKETWQNFAKVADRFERQRLSCDAGLAFEFAEGALVDAIQTGKWVLLDEINLASSDTLQRLCGLLDEPTGSLTLTERGDATAIKRHPNFRLFAAMNPATDAGKKDLPASIRCRFSELYVDELLDPIELRLVAARCLDGVLPTDGNAPEHTEIVACIVDQYLRCRELAQTTLSDGNGHKPRYTLRTLSRALKAAKNLVIYQHIRLRVAIFEGFQLSFEGILDTVSIKTLRKMLVKAFLREDAKKINLDHPGRRPGGKGSENDYVLIKPFWIKSGPLEIVDWSEVGANGKSKFILTTTAQKNLRRLARALATGPWPILLEGPTSSGKTTLVEYIAARCGHNVVRINNHEHTDVQEYTGAFAADQNGSLSFRDGILVQALRQGHWVILDELNLAPSEVLEALNRLLDDNRELYLAETNETVKPHPNFRLFATQNPSGAYGGRKPLSRAFRNRFVELHVGDIPSDEMSTILEKRCACPPSHAKLLVKIMVDLRLKRSKSNLFLGKDSFITPRDLLRWAERQCGSKKDLAEHGYMVLAERLRSEEEKKMVRDVLQEHTKVNIDLERLYYGENSEAKQVLNKALVSAQLRGDHIIGSIAPTRSMLRLIHLVTNCIKQKEPVLLVGDTGCGKTTVVQLLSSVLDQELFAVNCHATTETSDLIGGLRPVRGRDSIKKKIVQKLKKLIQNWPYDDLLDDLNIEEYVADDGLDVKQSGDKSSGKPEKHDVNAMVALAKTISSRRPEISNNGSSKHRTKKRRKVSESSLVDNSTSDYSEASDNDLESIAKIAVEIEDLGRQFNALFEWSDGPLVKAMKMGKLMLLDEMSLAEDAVLERLNSVLEPSRLLVLAEKGDDGSAGKGKDSRIITAHDSFRIFATMNPGGDYGKRELSPALRSRFTEIWVPSISERSDFEIVLGRSLSLNLKEQMDFQQSWIISRILDYVEWFNSDICGAVSSPYAGFSLSLRDILSWTNFIVEARKSNSKLTIWDALYHGACLMHLDGLGLGSGLASDSSTALKLKAEQHLSSLLENGKISNAKNIDEPICIQNGKFGVFPYFIGIGKALIPESSFNMAAPTTSLNAFRVLRAMQLKKPILLEGSPGVGKTSLINALASASGNKLVRINLSEQTDVSDLMGSDLPVEDPTQSGPSFEWCDGVLLTAIKEGSWVLLDELNLASQAVLEGLNSCLDHRATVYIPELGKSFDCPSTFRIFAAQNPLGQGGGRKGLPKSFLNRFTKVFVDALTDSDLRSIVSSRFKSFSKDFVNQIIDFNNDIHNEVVHLGEYGSEGGPWEFNLRDVFRWCELIDAGHSSYAAGARDLYYQRFRNQEDRDRVDKTFEKHFGRSMISSDLPGFEIFGDRVRIGETELRRLRPFEQKLRKDPRLQDSELIFSRLIPMEAVARCINLRWPCLLVGGSGSGKSSIVSSLASLCNATLVEHYLSPSSDVTELVGGFEQSDTCSKDIQIVKDLCMLANNLLMTDAFECVSSKSCLDITTRLQRYVGDWDNSSPTFEDSSTSPWKEAEKLSAMLGTMIRENASLSRFEESLKIVEKQVVLRSEKIKTDHNEQSGQFIWRDGILVEALVKGQWLLLENANLCPASVLDRLNSVTERDGFLLLSESGTQEGENSTHAHRIIKPHKNFRIFFTMNAANGEISRAMRNRCVEISLLESTLQKSSPADIKSALATPNFSGEQKVDFISIIRGGRVRSMEVASTVLSTYVNQYVQSSAIFEELPSLRSMFTSVHVLSGLLCRGVDPIASGEKFVQLSFEVEESDTSSDFARDIVEKIEDRDATPLPSNLILNSASSQSKTVWEARLLRLLAVEQSNVEGSIRTILNAPETDQFEREAWTFPSPRQFLCIISQLFVNSKSYEELQKRTMLVTGFESQVAYTVKWMSSVLGERIAQLRCSKEHPCFHDSSLLTWRRLHQLFVEHEWVRNLARSDTFLDSPNGLTVLEASYYMHESLLDRSVVPCSVTGLLYQFFMAIDIWTENALMTEDSAILANFLPKLRVILDERDKLWTLLTTLQLNLDVVNGFAAFDESEFIVQWQWLQKKLFFGGLEGPSIGGWKQVDLLIKAIDRAIYGGPRPSWSPRGIRKRMMKRLVPRRSDHWEALFSLEALSSGCSLVVDHRFDPFQKHGSPIDLEELLRVSHPSLYVTDAEKRELLGAISTSQLSWTSMSLEERSWIDEIDFPQKLNKVFDKLKSSFEVQVASAKVDLDIQTADNQIESNMMDDLKDLSAATISKIDGYCSLKRRLLSIFSKVQISALAEFWCVHQEVHLCGELSKLLLTSTDEKSTRLALLRLKSRIKSLVDTVITKTIWKVSDMQAFQLLVWASEGKSSEDLPLKRLLRSLLPTIISTSTRHTFTGSFVCPESISCMLDMPDMWTNEVIQNESFDNFVQSDKECDIGNVRLRQPVRTEILLKLIGKQLSFAKKPSISKMYTIENAVHRESQSKEILRMLSTLSVSASKARLYTYHYILLDILSAARDSLQDNTMNYILSLVENPSILAESSGDQISAAGQKTKNIFFDLFWDDFLFPLLGSLRLAWHEDLASLEYNKQCSRASVYLGLLRLNLLTPCTPLDPGKAPLAKVSLITQHLVNIQARLVANRLHTGFVHGTFLTETPENKFFLENIESLSKKRNSQQKKVIQRIESAPVFSELFRETRDFLSTALGNSSVLELVDKLSTFDSKIELIQRRAQNWQRTSAAFCRRLSSDFSAFEDVTLPMIDSVQMVQDGLFDLMRQRLSTPVKIGASSSDIIGELHRYPMNDASDSIRDLLSTIGVGNFDPDSESFKAICTAILSRLFLKKQLVGLERDEILVCSRIFSALTNSCRDQLDVKEDTSLEEMQERIFREQFPDHRKEFSRILDDQSNNHDQEDAAEATSEGSLDNTTDKGLTDAQIELLYQIYSGIFSSKRTFQTDSVRKIAFHSSYAAAYELQKDSQNEDLSQTRSEWMGGHFFAICLSSIPKAPMTRTFSYFRESSKVIDFHNEACPAMALSATEPLEKLMARVTQLLTAFPGHSILIGLGKVCEKVNKLNIMTTPIGKVMTGLEVVLKQAQDWEQHASEKVQIGSPLTAIGRLISEWRKSELESWGKLIQGRHNRHVSKAQRYWMRLRGILFNNTDPIDAVNFKSHQIGSWASQRTCTTPQWTWKGYASISSKLFDVFDDTHIEDAKELVKALDTFILTSPLGEIEERLKMLRTCADESAASCQANEAEDSWALKRSRILHSIWSYYNQYLPGLMQKLTDLRAPIEEKLKNETKLAKWDNQSYYALAESTERNQRKLMKILSVFDESLYLNIGVIVQQESCSGLRSSVDAHDEFCATFPSFTSMFPIQGITKEHPLKNSSLRNSCDILSVDDTLVDSPAGGHIRKITKYAHKMDRLSATYARELPTSNTRIGGDVASSFCQAIFDRIESLRSNSTRPMKERALVDLFRELKENGYTTTKWSTPSQLKDIEQIFLLPTPEFDAKTMDNSFGSCLGKGEEYFLRCINEANALKSETTMLGSKYMSKREMDTMVNLGFSGIHLLTQQRCLVSNLLIESEDLREFVVSTKNRKQRLPFCQSELKAMLKTFHGKFKFAFESLNQLSLLLESSKALQSDDAQNSWLRDSISKLKLICSETLDVGPTNLHFVTWEMCDKIKTGKMQLSKAKELVVVIRRECKDISCLPLDPFDGCLESIEHALASALETEVLSQRTRGEKLEVKSPTFAGFPESLSSLVERVLLTYQILSKEINSSVQPEEAPPVDPDAQSNCDVAIWECHKQFLRLCTRTEMKKLNQSLFDLTAHVRQLHELQQIQDKELDCYVGLVSNTSVLVSYLHQMFHSLVEDYVYFYISTAKLNYVILRVFRSLVAKGYCSDKTSEEDGEGEGDVKGMTFDDDNDGTGMGEGEGKKDVTDQIENEDQLAGLKSDKDEENDKKQEESKQLNEEEADHGMEMEGDFDGEMYDLPEKPQDENETEEQEGEELDTEMGEDANPDDQVVDEKMWNDSDDEDDINKEEEKFEEDGGVKGEAIEDAMRTNEDEEEGEKPDGDDDNSSKDDAKENKPEGAPNEVENQDDGEEINDDTEDKYEDQHNVDVRVEDDQDDQGDQEDLDDQMQLDDNMDLDENDQESNPDEMDAQETEETVENASLSDEDGEDDDNLDDNPDESGDDDNDETENEKIANKAEEPMDLENDGGNDPEKDEEEKADDSPIEKSNEDPGIEEVHGIRSKDGTDAIMEDGNDEEEEADGDNNEENDVIGNPSGGKSDGDQAEMDGNDDGGYSNSQISEENEKQSNESPNDVPNPMKDPGDASKFWHRKLNVIESNDAPEDDNGGDDQVDDKDVSQSQNDGTFEYSGDHADSTQVLGEATEEEAVEMEMPEQNEDDKDDNNDEGEKKNVENESDKLETKNIEKSQSRPKNQRSSIEEKQEFDENAEQTDDGSILDERHEEHNESEHEGMEVDDEDDDLVTGTHVVSDLSKLRVDGTEINLNAGANVVEDEYVAKTTFAEVEEARSQWLSIQGETQSLSRRLCEKLRLVMEPLVASKLRGDYRTGKRINMKRVIGYIASGYRKDKIWLRRTKPAKRNYRVLLAVDDSESMLKSGAGEMALHAMATVAVGMNQLEIGELGVASFGDDMKLVHPFHMPFTSESGVGVVQNFKFQQQRTRIAMCVESAMAALEDSGDGSSMQLVFLISDGRIERDSRSVLKRLIREMTERNILLAMIIVEGKGKGNGKKKDSILNMKEVTFEKGRPVVKRFIDDYPFPYYIVLDDVASLPEVLGDALKQWFEMLTQLQTT